MWSILTFPFRLIGSVLGLVFEFIGSVFGFVMGLFGSLLGLLFSGLFSVLIIVGIVFLVRWFVRGVRGV